MKKALLLLLVVCSIQSAEAQQIFKTGGTSNSTFLLGNTLATHNQCLYFPADLTNVQSGDIIRLYYKYGTTGEDVGNTLGDLLIQMGQTTATGFSGTNYYTGLDTVLNAVTFDIPIGITGDWFPIDLTVPFTYDASQTLIIDTQWGTSLTNNFGCYGGPNNDVKLYSADNVSLTGSLSSSTLQDVGFDLDIGAGVNGPLVTNATLNLQPNPATNEVLLTWNKADPITVKLHDGLGRVVREFATPTGGSLTLDLEDLNEGYYFVALAMNDGSTVVRKLSKLR